MTRCDATTGARRQALVTASSQGLGLACAEALLAQGCAVVLNGRDPDRLQQAVKALAEHDRAGAVGAIAGDLTQAATRQQLQAAVPEPDILVLNLGGPPARANDSLTEAHWREAFDQLYWPAVDLLQRYLPGMRARGWGRVVVLSSTAVRLPLPGLATSTVNRLALSGWMQCLVPSAMADGVTLNAILPGRILTPRQQRAAEREAGKAGITPDAQLQRWAQAVPAGRLGQPAEVGALCAFLCSVAAGYITGQHIQVDGGALPVLF